MPQSLSTIYIHVVFTTKDRRPFLTNVELRRRLHEYLGGACRKLECHSVIIGGVEDHVHLLVRLSRSVDVSKLVREINGLTEYIASQEEHHREESFQEEFRRLLRKYDVEWDERYVWD